MVQFRKKSHSKRLNYQQIIDFPILAFPKKLKVPGISHFRWTEFFFDLSDCAMELWGKLEQSREVALAAVLNFPIGVVPLRAWTMKPRETKVKIAQNFIRKCKTISCHLKWQILTHLNEQ